MAGFNRTNIWLPFAAVAVSFSAVFLVGLFTGQAVQPAEPTPDPHVGSSNIPGGTELTTASPSDTTARTKPVQESGDSERIIVHVQMQDGESTELPNGLRVVLVTPIQTPDKRGQADFLFESVVRSDDLRLCVFGAGPKWYVIDPPGGVTDVLSLGWCDRLNAFETPNRPVITLARS